MPLYHPQPLLQLAPLASHHTHILKDLDSIMKDMHLLVLLDLSVRSMPEKYEVFE